jgi:hypothetical protein
LKDNKTPLASVRVNLDAQVFYPDQTVAMKLDIDAIRPNVIISGICCKLRKCYQGKLVIQRGTVHRIDKRDLLQMNVPVAGNSGHLEVPVNLKIPSLLVSPCFASHHVRVYYYIVVLIMFESGSLLKSTHHSQFEVPIGMANIANKNLVRIHDLASVQDYTQSKASPYFFYASLESAPMEEDAPLYGTMTDDWMYENALDPPPPSYGSLEGSRQFIKKKRVEKTIYTSRLVKPNVSPELGEPLLLCPFTDNDW